MLKTHSSHRITVFALTAALLVPVFLAAGERATTEQAQTLVARAISIYEQAGRDAAFVAFEDPSGGFVDRDLYIFVYGSERTIVAHGNNPALVGTVVDTYIDPDGVPFGARIRDEATEEGVWIDYKWHDPVTLEILQKSSWVVLHDDLVFGAGIYKP